MHKQSVVHGGVHGFANQTNSEVLQCLGCKIGMTPLQNEASIRFAYTSLRRTPTPKRRPGFFPAEIGHLIGRGLIPAVSDLVPASRRNQRGGKRSTTANPAHDAVANLDAFQRSRHRLTSPTGRRAATSKIKLGE
jgi:hypothetical protein